jgi:hypothetical protein
MSPEDCIAALDRAIAASGYEEITLRRIVGKGNSAQNIDVDCLAQVNAVSMEEIAAGIAQTDLNVVISPTQINRKQWPGGHVPALPPFNVDQRVPRENADKVIVRQKLRTVGFVDPKFVGGVLVRINMRVTG